jgi:hypothetical protein
MGTTVPEPSSSKLDATSRRCATPPSIASIRLLSRVRACARVAANFANFRTEEITRATANIREHSRLCYGFPND